MGALFRSAEEINKNLSGSLLEKGEEPQGNVVPFHSGRRSGDECMSPDLKKLIGTTAAILSPNVAAKAFNVPHSTASQLRDGITSNVNGVKKIDESLAAAVLNKKIEINKRAVDLLFDSLATVKSEEIGALDVKERIRATKDLADIVERTSPKTDDGRTTNSFVILAPTLVAAEKFEVLLPENA